MEKHFNNANFERSQTLDDISYHETSSNCPSVTEFNMPVPWGEIRGKVWGPDHGRPILCLHGWADNCGTFNTLIPLLPKEWKCVAVDMAGHGLSSHRPPGVFYSFPAYVADIRRVIGALQWKRFSIIGHSMGGNVAGIFSALYPEMVDSVVLLDSYGFLPTDAELHTVIRQGLEGMLEFEKKKDGKKEKVYTYENALMRLLAANPSLSEQSAHILLERGLAQVEGGVVFTRDFRINLKNVVRVSLEQSLELQSRIQARVLVVLAEEGFEKMFSEPQQKTFTSTLLQGYKDQSGMVVNVPGDHHVHLNTPETVAQLITDFLQKEAPSHSTAEDTQAAKL
ncbi:serine hydrolase-like protein isoform X2 [Oncorhynchus nerka]|uniref:serine hydrolase-like protein isoform X2 n=1 Tax=Oncorhynchus nerka TaxID=8023 RepID=UPI0031B889A8